MTVLQTQTQNVEISTDPTVEPTALIPSISSTPVIQPTAEPSILSTLIPSSSPSPTETPKIKDDNGHGNDDGNCDPSNPGKSKTDCIRA